MNSTYILITFQVIKVYNKKNFSLYLVALKNADLKFLY